jgi:hypothetical protein
MLTLRAGLARIQPARSAARTNDITHTAVPGRIPEAARHLHSAHLHLLGMSEKTPPYMDLLFDHSPLDGCIILASLVVVN